LHGYGSRERVPMSASHRTLLTATALLMVLLSSSMQAQRGRHGRQGQGSGGTAAQPSDSSDMQEFKRAVEQQATPDQTTQFQAMLKSTVTALDHTQQFANGSESRGQSGIDGELGLFKLAMDDVSQRQQDFLGSFSDAQKNDLKKLIKSVRKAESDATKQWKDLQKELQKTSAQGSGTAEKTASLSNILQGLQTEQKNLGTEMGIDLSKLSVQPAPQPVLTPR